MVVFSSVISYLLAPNVNFDIKTVLLFIAGGMFVTGSANAINQILEKDTDKNLYRTIDGQEEKRFLGKIKDTKEFQYILNHSKKQ
jgi:heme O synthase-like polyprenyltransferase